MRMLKFFALSLFAISSVALGKTPTTTDVVIVGAGLSGLATAYQLKKAGIKYHILELTPRIGGRVRTVKYERPGESTLIADSGMEEYWESNPAVALLKELKLPLRSDYAASSLVLGGKIEGLGVGEDVEKFLRRIFTKQEYAALEAFKKKVEPTVHEILVAGPAGRLKPTLMKLKDTPFSEWVKKQGVPKKVADWIRISIECEIGTEWDRISALDGLAEFHIFLGQGELSFRVIDGNEKFTEALGSAVGLDNISTNKRVNKIVSDKDGVTVTFLDQTTNQNEVIRGKRLVSTIPLFRLFEVQFEPALSPEKRAAIASQTWGSYFKVHAFMKAEAAKKYFEPKPDASILPLLSDSELGVIYDGNPEQDTPTKVISLLVTGQHAEMFNMMPLDQVREKIKAGFEKFWPGSSKAIEGMEFYRFHPRAIASWPVGRSRFDKMAFDIRKPEHHVLLGGDFTENTHSSGAFISATRVSTQIIGELAPGKKANSPGAYQ